MKRLEILYGLWGAFWKSDKSVDMARRWTKTLTPEMKHDLIELGGLLQLPPVEIVDGMPQPVSQDLYQCGREAGRAELAKQLLALGGLTIEELNMLMQEDDHEI